jgi:ABC-type transporter Mla subunit MlaD
VLRLLDAQRAALGTAIDASDRVVAELSSHAPDVTRFVSQAARATTVTAAHAQPLSLAIARLPALLRTARPALRHLDRVAVTGTPLIAQIHASAPTINSLTAELGPFTAAVAPVLTQLTPVLNAGTRTAIDVRPLLALISRYARISLPNAISTGQLFVSLRQHGFSEAFLGAVYYLASTIARFDSIGHFAVSTITGNQCTVYAATPVPGCSSDLGGVASAVGIQSGAPDSNSTARAPDSNSTARASGLINYLLR